jgi:CspA family cold shock protein
MQGTIKRLTDKGFGFIGPDNGDKDIFFHSNDLSGVQYADLKEGDKVSFEIGQSEKGPKAINVMKV